MSDGTGPAALLVEQVLPAFTTVHLPPDRAVLTTPALVGLMERCVGAAEAAAGSSDSAARWQSTATEVRHRAGLRAGRSLTLTAEREAADGGSARWRVAALAVDGTPIGDGWIERALVQACRS